MASFSIDFPDDIILAVLGDDIDITDLNGVSTSIKGAFSWDYMRDELGELIDIKVPMIEVNDEHSDLFVKKYKVTFNGDDYTVLNKRPGDPGKVIIILRSYYID